MKAGNPLAIVPFGDRIRATPGAGAPLRRGAIDVLQVNVGKLCNQACTHCHVDAGPTRTEQMSRETAEACLRFLSDSEIPVMDLTGGAPELCPEFERLVLGARALGRRAMIAATDGDPESAEHLPGFA
jgi:MoaA/NifB/PqqE/SkfB family radical SAM enzyme